MKGTSVFAIHNLFKGLPAGVVTDMASLILSPAWFQGIDGLFEFFSGVVAFLIAFASWKAYKLTNEGRFKMFSLAFGFITLSFIARLITAMSVLIETAEDTFEPVKLQLNELEGLFSLGRFAYVLLVLAGYLIIVVLSLNIKSQRTIALLSIMTLILALLSHQSNVLIGSILLLFLLFISIHFFENYKQKKTAGAFLTFAAFVLLIVEAICFILGKVNPAVYVGGYIVRSVAYMLLLSVVVRAYR